MISDKTIYHSVNTIILSTFFVDYLGREISVLPRIFTWLPDLLSIALLVVFLLVLAVSKKVYIKKKYLFLLFLFLIHITLSALFNYVPAGAVFAGLRTYLRYLPLFLLPTVLGINEKLLKGHLKLLFFLSLVQVPLSIYQRFFQFKGVQTGDVVSGTLLVAPFLVIFQISVICYLLALYIKGKINIYLFLLISIVLFIPCTINETKAVLILLPASLLGINFFSPKRDLILSKYIVIPSCLVLLVAIFIPIYDHFIQQKWGYGIVDFIQKEGRVKGYLYKGATGSDENETIGRIDSINIAMDYISKDPIKFFYGYGIGNVGINFLPKLRGEYTEYESLGVKLTTISTLLWETGLFGVIFLFSFIYFIFHDATLLSHSTGLLGDIALTWIGISIIFFLSTIYIDLIHHNLIFIYSYFSGLIATGSYRLN